jgi:hypothetical protein
MGGRRAGLRVLCLRPKHSSDNSWKWNSNSLREHKESNIKMLIKLALERSFKKARYMKTAFVE